MIAVMLLAVPLPWLLGWLIAAAVHECSHWCMLRLCGKRIYKVYLDFGGAKMQTDALSNGQTVLCALAGPVGGMMLLAIANTFPHAALCALILSAYNLLPIYPLDGGRALQGFLQTILPDRYAKTIFIITEKTVLLALSALCTIAAFKWKLGLLPIAAFILFTMRMYKIKIPCKSNVDRVQ